MESLKIGKDSVEATADAEEISNDAVGADSTFIITKERDSLEAALSEIRQCLKKTAESHIQLAKVIKAYSDKAYETDIRRKLVSDKIMSDSCFSMYVKIGLSRVLTDPKYVDHLPDSFNTLYHLAKLGDKELEKKMLAGEITPMLRLVDARMMRKPTSRKKKTGGDKTTHTFSFRVSGEDWQKYRKEIEDLLASLKSDHPYFAMTEGAV